MVNDQLNDLGPIQSETYMRHLCHVEAWAQVH